MTTRTNRLRTFLFLIAFITTASIAGVKEGVEAYKAKDYQTALKIFVPLAEAGDPEAQLYLGKMYRWGYGLPKSIEKAGEWIQRSSDQDYPDAKLELSSVLFSKYLKNDSPGEPISSDPEVIKELAKARELLLAAANAGSHEAQFVLAVNKESGWNGFKRDIRDAIFWYEKSANNGNVVAAAKLGTCYAYAGCYGFPERNPEKAFAWYKKGAEICLSDRHSYDDSASCRNRFYDLAVAYFYGRGTREDKAKAFKFLRLAEGKGADLWGEVYYLLALSYLYGYGTDIDYESARRIFSDLIKLEPDFFCWGKQASYMLGLMYLDGKGVPQNHIKAIEYFTYAASKNNCLHVFIKAKSMLGEIYFYGRGVPVDYQKSYAWFSLAVADGDVDAQKNRDIVGAKLTPQQLNSARQMAAQWAKKDEECDTRQQDSSKGATGSTGKANTPRIERPIPDSTKSTGRSKPEGGKSATNAEKLAPNPF